MLAIVHRQGDAIHAVVLGQKAAGVGHVLRIDRTAQQIDAAGTGEVVIALRPAGIYQTGCHATDPDHGRQCLCLQGHAAFQSQFAGGVRKIVRVEVEHFLVQQMDDAGVCVGGRRLAGGLLACQFAAQQQRGNQVHFQLAACQCGVEIDAGVGLEHRCVVHHCAQAAAALGQVCHHGQHFRFMRQVCGHGVHRPAFAAQFFLQGMRCVARAGVMAPDVPTRLRKAAHQDLAQTVCAAGNQNMVCHGVSLGSSGSGVSPGDQGAPHNRRHRNSPARRMEPCNPLEVAIRNHLAAHSGWMGFDEFMQQALYTPGLGYYANELPKFGHAPQAPAQPAGSDFVTAPELSPLFGYALARQVAQALQATGTDEIWEFGAGSGALAGQLLDALDEMGVAVRRYNVVELSQTLAARQRAGLERHAARLHWAEVLPDAMRGVLIGNEVLDAMPVQLLARVGGVWHERGVACANTGFVWSDRRTSLRPPCEIEGDHDYLCEIHPQGEAFVRSLGQRLQQGLIVLLDYGFGQDEYYHPQRHMGTVMCHRGHRSDMNPLADAGLKDISAHVNFSGILAAGEEAGLDLLGYTTQAHFLMNCGLIDLMQAASAAQRNRAERLILEHEMGELFKVIALGRGLAEPLLGFARGDRSHRL